MIQPFIGCALCFDRIDIWRKSTGRNRLGIGCPQLPYYGDPLTVPGTIEAEDFDLGPNGEAYYDDGLGNNGGALHVDGRRAI